jgi:hypothetical protein
MDRVGLIRGWRVVTYKACDTLKGLSSHERENHSRRTLGWLVRVHGGSDVDGSGGFGMTIARSA